MHPEIVQGTQNGIEMLLVGQAVFKLWIKIVKLIIS